MTGIITRTSSHAVACSISVTTIPPAVEVCRRPDEDGGNYRKNRIKSCCDFEAFIAFDRFMRSGGKIPTLTRSC